MTAPQLLPADTDAPSPWDQALYAFLIEKGHRSGSRRTVEGYSRMLWPFFQELGKTPDQVTPADVLAWAHGIGKSGRTPSAVTIGKASWSEQIGAIAVLAPRLVNRRGKHPCGLPWYAPARRGQPRPFTSR